MPLSAALNDPKIALNGTPVKFIKLKSRGTNLLHAFGCEQKSTVLARKHGTIIKVQYSQPGFMLCHFILGLFWEQNGLIDVHWVHVSEHFHFFHFIYYRT